MRGQPTLRTALAVALALVLFSCSDDGGGGASDEAVEVGAHVVGEADCSTVPMLVEIDGAAPPDLLLKADQLTLDQFLALSEAIGSLDGGGLFLYSASMDPEGQQVLLTIGPGATENEVAEHVSNLATTQGVGIRLLRCS